MFYIFNIYCYFVSLGLQNQYFKRKLKLMENEWDALQGIHSLGSRSFKYVNNRENRLGCFAAYLCLFKIKNTTIYAK